MNKRGFTLIELLVVISIISLLSSIVMASIRTAQAKARFVGAVSQMRQINLAAEQVFTNTGNYPADVNPDSLPPEMAPYIQSWPKPPCSGWTYDWENWTATNGFLGVTLRDASVNGKYFMCLDRSQNCQNGSGQDVQTSARTLDCS